MLTSYAQTFTNSPTLMIQVRDAVVSLYMDCYMFMCILYVVFLLGRYIM